MFTFAYPGMLFLLLLIPGFIFIYIISRYLRKRKLKKFGDKNVLKELMPSYSPYKSNIRFVISMLALASIIFAMARPWGGVKNQESVKEGIEIVIAVDASNSMLASASDDENGIDRMRLAKLTLERLIGKLSNDRVGLIAFAGDAYTLIPVTNDYISAKAFLNSIEPENIPYQGTNIAAAINMAQQSFSEKGDIGKAIILLTDAEELLDKEGVLNEVKQATKRGIQVDVIGIGSTPMPIPDKNNKAEKLMDGETGNIVKTALDESMAIEIAKEGNGIYVNASNDEAINELEKHLGNLKKAAIQSSFMVTHDELYYPFVIFAIILLLIEFFLTDKKNRLLDKVNFFGKGKSAIVIVMLLSVTVLSSCAGESGKETAIDTLADSISYEDSIRVQDSLRMIHSTEKERDLILKGNDLYRNGRFEEADSNYMAALEENDLSPVANINLGVNAMNELIVKQMASADGTIPEDEAKQTIDRATQAFNTVSQYKIDKGNISSHAFYNLGNIAFVKEEYGKAIDYYKEALRMNPNDDMARRNLRIAQLQKNQNNQNQNQQDQQDEQDQQDQQNNSQEQSQPQQEDRTQLNEQTSQQILDAAERKESERRQQLQNEENRQKGARGGMKPW